MMVKIQRSAGGGREHGQRTYLRGIEVGVSEGRRRFWGLRRRRSAVVCALAEASAARERVNIDPLEGVNIDPFTN